MTSFATLLLLAPLARAEALPAGAVIEQAGVADITPEGFEAIAAIIPSFVPDAIAVDAISGGYDGVWGQCWLGGYEYSVSGMNVGIEVVRASIVPANGVLDVTADVNVWINDASDTFDLYTELECIGDTCDSYVEPFPVTLSTTIGLDVVTGSDGKPVLDAIVGTPVITYDLSTDYIHLDNCAIGVVEDIADFLGLSLVDFILGQFDSTLQDTVAGIVPELETTLEDAFSSATISQQLDLNGAVAQLDLYPNDVEITPAGARIQLAGAVDAEVASCVAAYDPGGSLKTPSSLPSIGAAPAGVDAPFHVGVTLSDDFANQALYALWRGGLLCYSLEPGGAFPLDTSILNALSGNAFEEMFPESQPMTLRTVPRVPPTAVYGGGHTIDVALDDLDLEFYADLDGRSARMLTLSLDGTAGADLAFDGTTGQLGVAVDIDPAALTPTVTYNEFVPDAEDAILAGFASTFGGLLETALGGLLGDLAFGVPGFSGIGLTDLQSGVTGDWLGLYAFVGPITYEATGCGEGGGCSGGCSVGGNAVPSPVFWMAGLAVLLRRRASRS